MKKITLNVQERTLFGRKVKSLRKKGIVPANLYGKKQKSMAVQLDVKEFSKTYDEAGETNLVDLVIGKISKPVLIDNVQKDPVTGEFLHIDFRQVDLKEKIETEVPIEIIGESPIEKQGTGTVVQYINEIEVEALPSDLPEKFEIDVTPLNEVGKAIYVKELSYDKGKVSIKTDPEEIVVKVEPLREEEPEIVEPVAEEGLAEAEVGEKKEEGENIESTQEGTSQQEESGK